MRTLLALLVVAGAAAPALADGSFTIHHHKATAGDKWTDEKFETTNLTVDAKGKKVAILSLKTIAKTIEVTKVSGGFASEEKITYTTVTETENVAGTDRAKASPIAGKTYKLTAGAPVVVEALAGQATPDEVDAVRKQERYFGKADKLDAVLEGKTFQKGIAVKLPSQDLAGLFGDRDVFQRAEMSLTYEGTTGNAAAFAFTLTTSGDQDGAHWVMEASGSLSVDAKSSVLHNMKMKGAIKATGGKAPLDGTIEISARRS